MSMSGPYTSNTGLIVAVTGSLVDVWADQALNPDFVALDGLLGGVQSISVTNAPVTLTSPAGFTPTPGGGPTQSQNRVLRFTGALSGDVRVTLPIPGAYIIENLTTGAHVLSFQGVTATEVIGTPQGERLEIYNDGANVRFVNLARVGTMEMWAGISAMPAWVAACTVKPYLLCDAAVYNYSDYPALSARLGGSFGGNGITTFATPDMRGRVPLAYDGTGARITAAGCGINGQTLGAALDAQTVTIVTGNLPPYTPSGTVAITAHVGIQVASQPGTGGAGQLMTPGGSTPVVIDGETFTGTAAAGQISTPMNNVQPSIVTGLWAIKT
jgi:microcystin-dependent protein